MLDNTTVGGSIVERALSLLGEGETVGILSEPDTGAWFFGTIESDCIDIIAVCDSMFELASKIIDLKNQEDLKKIRAAGW